MKTPSALALGLATCVLSVSAFAAEPPRLVPLWETEPTLLVPEGVHLDEQRRTLYVSNIDGTEPWAKDGRGSIAKVAFDGRVVSPVWITGLNAPKGMARVGDRLYVADVDQIVTINIEAGEVDQRLTVPGARRLNDVTADSSGKVYVTDSETGRVHRIENGTVTEFSRAFKSPNGILATGNRVFVLDQETLFQVDPTGRAEPRARGIKGHVDGIEAYGDGFLVTCWEGMIYHVAADGTVSLLLDTRDQKANAADPAYNAKERILYIPTFWRNTVVAYRVE